MSSLRLYNRLTKQTESFTPLNPPRVHMYSCGPTVYDFAHIGNLRSYVFADILHRTLEFSGYTVKHVINITDVGHLSGDGDAGEDKMMKGLKREGLPISLSGMKELALKFENHFKEDTASLNIKPADVYPRASEHIEEQQALIRILTEKGFTYTTRDGVYFDTSKDPHYGVLGGLTEHAEARARVDENSEKRNARDFALWKFNTDGWSFDEFGTGFPGWHIECSAMSQKYLGETFDIHTGGIDHISIHHNNEIAQSECAHDKPLARFWMHNEFVNVDSGKMAKSEGNFITLKTLKEHGIHPLAYRYWLLTAHYRTPIEFSYEAVQAAQNALEHLLLYLVSLPETHAEIPASYKETIAQFINDDLNTPQLIAYFSKIEHNTSATNIPAYAIYMEIDKILGLNFAETLKQMKDIPADIKALVEKRNQHKIHKEWQEADQIREEILAKGFTLMDTERGTVVTRTLASLIE